MNEIMCFLNSHSEIKTVVYYIDAYYGISFLKNFNEYTVVSKIIIVCNTFTIYTKVQKAFKESISNKERYLFDVQIVMAENFAITENNWAFCAEQLSDKMSLSLLDLHPSYILINLLHWQTQNKTFSALKYFAARQVFPLSQVVSLQRQFL